MKREKHCKCIRQMVVLSIIFASLCACGTNSKRCSSEELDSCSPETVKGDKKADIQEREIRTVLPGNEYYEGFLIDNVLSFLDGTEELHFHIYLPESYDSENMHPLYITLPGYGGYYFQGVGINLQIEHFAIEAMRYGSDMIIVALQPNDWGRTSANQTIKLTEYLLSAYSIDPNRVYISGYSGGGETLSLVLGIKPQLYAAALHISSQWDSEYELLIQNRIPLYFAIGEADEYYGSESVINTYAKLKNLYEKEGLSENEINEILILDVKDQSYFTNQGVSNQHGGGGLIAYDNEIMNWLFSK